MNCVNCWNVVGPHLHYILNGVGTLLGPFCDACWMRMDGRQPTVIPVDCQPRSEGIVVNEEPDFPPFDEKAACPVCGCGEAETHYRTMFWDCGLREYPHLERICARCGYRWQEATIQDKPPRLNKKSKRLVEGEEE